MSTNVLPPLTPRPEDAWSVCVGELRNLILKVNETMNLAVAPQKPGESLEELRHRRQVVIEETLPIVHDAYITMEVWKDYL